MTVTRAGAYPMTANKYVTRLESGLARLIKVHSDMVTWSCQEHYHLRGWDETCEERYEIPLSHDKRFNQRVGARLCLASLAWLQEHDTADRDSFSGWGERPRKAWERRLRNENERNRETSFILHTSTWAVVVRLCEFVRGSGSIPGDRSFPFSFFAGAEQEGPTSSEGGGRQGEAEHGEATYPLPSHSSRDIQTVNIFWKNPSLS